MPEEEVVLDENSNRTRRKAVFENDENIEDGEDEEDEESDDDFNEENVPDPSKVNEEVKTCFIREFCFCIWNNTLGLQPLQQVKDEEIAFADSDDELELINSKDKRKVHFSDDVDANKKLTAEESNAFLKCIIPLKMSRMQCNLLMFKL